MNVTTAHAEEHVQSRISALIVVGVDCVVGLSLLLKSTGKLRLARGTQNSLAYLQQPPAAVSRAHGYVMKDGEAYYAET